jgi:hypothetical protein
MKTCASQSSLNEYGKGEAKLLHRISGRCGRLVTTEWCTAILAPSGLQYAIRIFSSWSSSLPYPHQADRTFNRSRCFQPVRFWMTGVSQTYAICVTFGPHRCNLSVYTSYHGQLCQLHYNFGAIRLTDWHSVSQALTGSKVVQSPQRCGAGC